MSNGKHINLNDCKSYKTYENAKLAAEKAMGTRNLWFIIVAGTEKASGRFIPAFLGSDANDMLFKGFAWIVKA